jgi:hypothetical protein
VTTRAAISVCCAALATALLTAAAAATAAPKPPAELNTLKDVFAALGACWTPPPLEQSRPGMQITVQLSFKRNGEILGKPRITFESPGATDDDRLAYRIAIATTLKRCAPLPFTDALGNAVAGRPFNMRFIDNRKLKQAGLPPWPTPTTR